MILQRFASKKIIEIVMTKTNDGITEEISLDLLYDKLCLYGKDRDVKSRKKAKY